MLVPINITSIKYYINPDEFVYDYNMPMKSAFPFDTTKLPAYIFSYVMFVYRSYIVSLISVSSLNNLGKFNLL